MKCFVGIDLGSTTTKAVILDEKENIIGRGITNSRSNYHVACHVAKSEAFVNARFSQLGAMIQADLGMADEVASFLHRLEQRFRYHQYMFQLDHLQRNCLEFAKEQASSDTKADAVKIVEDIFAEMNGEAPTIFDNNANKRSNFFRDIAGSSFQNKAERRCGGSKRCSQKQPKVAFEFLIGLYDKAILQVESMVENLGFSENIRPALDFTLTRETGIFRDQAKNVEKRVQEVLETPFDDRITIGTGYGRSRLPFSKEHIRSEILCHGLGAHKMFPHTATVLDIGGQDTKAIQVDPKGIVTNFQMNDRCAAGCGRYLGYIADEMNLGLHELGPLSMNASRQIKINSTCTVFAGAELRDRLAMGQRREDILAGLHRAIILRAMSLLARSGGIRDEFTFTGGVAKNVAAVTALRQLVKENYGERRINISPDSIYTGALGAALFALRAQEGKTHVIEKEMPYDQRSNRRRN